MCVCVCARVSVSVSMCIKYMEWIIIKMSQKNKLKTVQQAESALISFL